MSDLNDAQDILEDALDEVKKLKFDERIRNGLGWTYYKTIEKTSTDKDDDDYAAQLERQKRILAYVKDGTPYPEYEAEVKEHIAIRKAAQKEAERQFKEHMREHEFENAKFLKQEKQEEEIEKLAQQEEERVKGMETMGIDYNRLEDQE